ncbi:hypothetical protein NDU88_003905 [Pleurodeles waltl]|uniref:Jacalin-type lectin domain-containing protein n=1 Tax=Pleurodeles waltl TaxID=8319 RepID=A0AAV7PI78_PLEWA|nr:hypothetical protein NDU88_003905 [Pleurodeles waltl]
MYALVAFALLTSPVLTSEIKSRLSSFSGEFGGGSGVAFTTSGEHLNGPITGLRIRESTSYILGIQIRFGSTWGQMYGSTSSSYLEVILRHGEHIIEASGKYSTYINELIFLTNQGRMFRFGQPSGSCFNLFPLNSNTVLRYISGRYSGSYITSIGFHWDKPRGYVSNGNGLAQVQAS